MPITNLAVTENIITATLEDGSTRVFTAAPVITDTEITVTHEDGSTEVFEPKK